MDLMKKKYVADSQNEIMIELKQLYRELVDFDSKNSNQEKNKPINKNYDTNPNSARFFSGNPSKNYP